MDYRARGGSKVCPLGLGMDEPRLGQQNAKIKKVSHRFINRCRMKDQVQDSSQIDLPSHLRVRVRQGIQSNVRCSISRLLKKLD